MNPELCATKTSKMNIIVTGSLGHISRPLAIQLVQKGHSVTVVSSNPEKRQAIEALGARAVIGSVEDAGFLARVFTNADAVYCMMPPRSFQEPDYPAYGRRIGGNYAEAVRRAGVRNVVHLSSWGAELDKGTGFILAAHEAEKAFDALEDISVVHIRPVSFYYNLFSFIPMIKSAGFMAANYGEDDRLVLVAPADIADAIVSALESPGDRIRYVASDESTCNEVSRVLGQKTGQPGLTWKKWTNQQMLDGLVAGGVPATVARGFVEIGAASRDGLLRKGYDLHKPVLGKVKLADFATEFAVQYNRS